jgi:DUF4097 and DUF4098 domain-containing protein YvlB
VRRETFAATEPIRLDLHVPAGEILVEAGDVAETTVELEALGGDDSRAAVDEARVDFRDGLLVVDVVEQRGFRLFSRGAEVGLRVRCPRGSQLEISAASADVKASGGFASADVESASGDVDLGEVAGDAKVKAASGDLRLGAIGGSLRAEAASGDIEVERVGGEAKVRTASGDVAIGAAETSLTVQTASGDQRIGSVTSGQVSLRSASGDIWIGIRRGAAAWLDVASISGETTSDLDVGGAPPAETEEGPRVEVRAQSMSGDVHVARAATVPDLG